MNIKNKKLHYQSVINGYLTDPSVLLDGEKVIRETDLDFLVESLSEPLIKNETIPEIFKVDLSGLSKANLEELEKNWLSYLESMDRDFVYFATNKAKHLPPYAGTFRTFSGMIMNVLDPQPEMIVLNDIVKGLAYNSHFSGQTPDFFSIAEHCLITEELVAKYHPDDIELRLVALLHDAAEAYIGDMIHPVKILFPEFKEMEIKLQKVIFQKFELSYDRMSEIKVYDLASQDHEATVFYGSRDNPQYEVSRAFVNFYGAPWVADKFVTVISKLLKEYKS